MRREREQHIRSLTSLIPVAEHTPILALIHPAGKDEDGTRSAKIKVLHKEPAPIDEFGIPRPRIMLERLLGVMTTKHYVWTGVIDLHHLATPRADYTAATGDDLGSRFRGLSQLKIDVPRQLHYLAHTVLDITRPPTRDVMHQAIFEVDQGKVLQRILTDHVSHSEAFWLNDRKVALCRQAILFALESMKEPEVNMMPSLEALSRLELPEMQQTIRAVTGIRRIGDKRIIHPAIRKPNAHHRIAA